jgi:ligand-binding sensor domain-containing protein
MFEDSSGRMWQLQYIGQDSTTIVISKDGSTVVSNTVPAQLNQNSFSMLEQDPQTFWAMTTKGFIRMKLSGGATPQLDEKMYAPVFPLDRVRNAYIDKERGLWIVSDLGLFRFELPPADK